METKLISLRSWLVNSVAVLLVTANCSTAFSCNIPVFRFALERWQPDSAEVVVFVRGDVTDAERQKIRQLQNPSEGDRQAASANLQVIMVDLNDAAKLNSEHKAYHELWDAVEAGSTDGPYVVIRTRMGKDKIVVSWKGLLRDLKPDQIANSPIRRELSRRLLSGDSVVWLVLRSSDKEKSDAVVAQLNEQFRRLSTQLQLPDGVGLPGSELYSEVPLFLKFSVIEIDPADEGEWFLIESLTRLETRFKTENQPLVVPVFGKGRALEVMAASDVTPELTEDLTRFLCSACSCQVKELNPGFDLVMTVPWNLELFGEEVAPEMAAPSRTGAANAAEPVLVPIPSGRAGKK